MSVRQEKTYPGLHDFLESILPPPEHVQNVLDIGCGSGAFLERMSRKGFRNLTGIDLIVPEPELKCAEFIKQNLNDKWTCRKCKYDLITCIEVIEHIQNIGILFDEIESSLADDGVLLLTTPNIDSIYFRIQHFLFGSISAFYRWDNTHYIPFPLESIERLLDMRKIHITNVLGYGINKGDKIVKRTAFAIIYKIYKSDINKIILCVTAKKKM